MPVLVMEYKYGNQYSAGRQSLVELYTEGIRYAIRSAGIAEWERHKPGNWLLWDQERYGRVFPFAGSYCDDLED